jgi:hypothetical protein
MHRRQGESSLSEINDLPHFELVARHVCLLIHSTWRNRSTFSAGLVICRGTEIPPGPSITYTIKSRAAIALPMSIIV